MQKLKEINAKIILVIIIFLFLINGCHTHLHFSPEFSPKMDLNTKPKDTLQKKDTIKNKK